MSANKKRMWIPALCAAAVIALGAAALFLLRGTRLSAALKKLDVSDELTVISVMKYGGDDPGAVLAVASAYADAGLYSDSVRFCLYALQYLDGGEDFLTLLKDGYAHLGAEKTFLSQFDGADFPASDFAVRSRFEGVGYGGTDGVYVAFCGGYARAKISSMIPLSLAAVKDGVYVLDAADDRLKLLSSDGLSVSAVTDCRVSAFLLIDGGLYYIDGDGTPVSPSGAKPLAEGERAMELREENGAAVCSVYGENYEKLRDMQI